jgi:nitrite reductase/ring-hydroxylating ferredoxin subunit
MNRRRAIKQLAAAGATVLLSSRSVLGAPFSGARSSTLTLSIADPRFAALAVEPGSVEITNGLVPGIQNVTPGGFPLTLIRTGMQSVTALGMECTHQQCLVGSFDGEKFRCPCHQSEFDRYGNRIAGPAQLPLPSFPATLQGDVVTVSGLPGDTDWNLTSADVPPGPASLRILSCTPHPFRDVLHVRIEARDGSNVHGALFDALGRRVRALPDLQGVRGVRNVSIHTGTLVPGTYILLIEAGRRAVLRHILKAG